MHIIACIDTESHMGLRYAGVRMDEDKAVLDHILTLAEGKTLRMSPDSWDLFKPLLMPSWTSGPKTLAISEDFFERLTPGEVCFLEQDKNVLAIEPNIERITLFVWGREQTADEKFRIDAFLFPQWKKVTSETIKGESHHAIQVTTFEKARFFKHSLKRAKKKFPEAYQKLERRGEA